MFCLWPFAMLILLSDYAKGARCSVPFFFLEEIDMTEEHSLLTGSVPKKLAIFVRGEKSIDQGKQSASKHSFL